MNTAFHSLENWLARLLCQDFILAADMRRKQLLNKGEALVAAQAWRAAWHKTVPDAPEGSCPFLDPVSARCRIYEGRPFGCRTHFCDAAGGQASRGEVRDFIRRLEEIDVRLGGSGGVNMPSAVRAAMG